MFQRAALASYCSDQNQGVATKGFSDPAYFCRFFKKLTGQVPSSFRAASTC